MRFLQTKSHLLLLVILFIGLVPRLWSVGWNVIPHGDVKPDVSSAASLAAYGCMMYQAYDLGLTRCPRTPEERLAQLHVQHPPAWPAAGAALLTVTGAPPTPASAFFSFQILSLASGMLVILLSFVAGRRLLSEEEGLLIAAWTAASYLMIDYSGNGAFYMAHAAVYLLWLLLAMRPGARYRATLLGVLAGIGYLLNYQIGMVLAPLTAAVLMFEAGSLTLRARRIAVFGAVSALIVAPFFMRNHLAFGNAFQSGRVNSIYLLIKAGQADLLNADHPTTGAAAAWLQVGLAVLFSWLPNNLYYIARKLFVLAPISFFLFSYAWIEYLFSRERMRRMLPVLLLCAAHLLISAAWPVTKFRYFVPLLPLVFLIAADQLAALPVTVRVRRCIACSTIVAMLAVSVLAFRVTRTHYYDGALTTDPFSGSEEMRFLRENGLIPSP